MSTRGQCHNPLPPEDIHPKHSDLEHPKHSDLKHSLHLLVMGASFIAYDLIERLWTGLATWGSGVSPPAASGRARAAGELAAAGYAAEAGRVLDEAAWFPGRWAYTADRHRCAVHNMPGDTWEVRDCAESEDRIAALRRAR
jgi:hypothetical protein